MKDSKSFSLFDSSYNFPPVCSDVGGNTLEVPGEWGIERMKRNRRSNEVDGMEESVVIRKEVIAEGKWPEMEGIRRGLVLEYDISERLIGSEKGED